MSRQDDLLSFNTFTEQWAFESATDAAQQVESAVFGAAHLTDAAFITRVLLALGGSSHSGGATELVGVPSGT